MYNFPSSTYHVWRPELPELVREAIGQQSTVAVHTHYHLDKCNTADLDLKGRIIKFTGHQAQFLVDSFDLHPGHAYPVDPECEYSFSIDQPKNDTGSGRVEYTGRALILDRELARNDLPQGLLLRLALPNRFRPLRRHKREKCPGSFIQMPGLMLIDKPPVNRQQLLNVLGHYYRQKSRPKPELVDISAGGVCLQTEDAHCLRFLGAEESYLFFFFSEQPGVPTVPHVFMGKKVGIFRSSTSRHAGLRIRFLREMVWTDPVEDLKWIDIDAEGSRTLQKLIDQWNESVRDNECG